MANPSIRGHQGQFKIFSNGTLENIVNLTSVTVTQDSSFMRSNYVGNGVSEGDQSIDGWSGSIEMEVKDAAADDFVDALINNNLNGIGISDYTFIVTENYANGTSRSYVYTDVQWKMSRKQSGQGEKITKTLEFQAAARLKL